MSPIYYIVRHKNGDVVYWKASADESVYWDFLGLIPVPAEKRKNHLTYIASENIPKRLHKHKALHNSKIIATHYCLDSIIVDLTLMAL
jgi:hypothetical protein